MRAILSVWDKTGLTELARGLVELGWELISTGGTQRALETEGVPVTGVSELTAFPEILDGRVKTLHPQLHAGILARRDLAAHRDELARRGIEPVDLVVSNLYPFVETIASQAVPFGVLSTSGGGGGGGLPPAVQEAIEQIDIGGPTMIRAAAKNFPHVIVVTRPADYPEVLAALRQGGPGAVPLALRAELAQRAFSHTAQYDAYVAQYFAAVNGAAFAEAVSLPLTRISALSYGENPHQQAAFYRLADPRLVGPGLADLEQLFGGALSYNNLLDLDSAYAIVAEFDQPAVAIVKHNNPCGVGVAATITEAYQKAFRGDPLSAHGGVVAANRPVGEPMVEAMSTRSPTGALYTVLVAPDYTARARRVFRERRRQTRVVKLPLPVRDATATRGTWLPGFGLRYRAVSGGFLAQTQDAVPPAEVTFTTVSRRAPDERELSDLRFAWTVVKHVRSNASVFARDGGVVGVGAGQMSRVDSVRLGVQTAARSARLLREREGLAHEDAGQEAGRPAQGCAMATDGFFPFPDGVEAAIEAGATAVVHPGGAKEDAAAVEVADRHGVAMVVTGYRHFRH
ncbi:MAG TPA: bifunctional phosphoribosylaminoimidazolecarboxamide formyltransferase/IMP cyclohydrolase [Chloroflexota bacterium]|nr:bifunctional phosphoribosylaminoimidazolecarboxamide formyltransferase/IMP cyclohydrolase [Chloroflexota bacterium]